jgi:hypothetical protein
MYSFMLARLREEVKGLDVGIAALSGDLKGSLSRQDAAALALHQAQAQRTRAVALVHALSRHLEVGRAQRRLKRERMEASIAGQEAKLREMDERDKKRLTMSLMPRVRACLRAEAALRRCARRKSGGACTAVTALVGHWLRLCRWIIRRCFLAASPERQLVQRLHRPPPHHIAPPLPSLLLPSPPS